MKSIDIWFKYRKMCILINIVHEYNNTYHSTIKMKSTDVNSSTHIDFAVKNSDKNPKFEAGDHVRMSNHKYFYKCLYSKLIERRFCN